MGFTPAALGRRRRPEEPPRPGRTVPDFIVIGAQKAGTTSLHHYLRQHPQVVAPRRRKDPDKPNRHAQELHFFDGGLNPKEDSFARGLSWYLEHFPPAEELTEDQRTFETSPLYLFNPLAPGRIADVLPDVKLIALLRDPTERAISHYHQVRKNPAREPLPIMAALLAEEERLKRPLKKRDYTSRTFRYYSYKLRGHYLEQIQRYLEHVPAQNMLIMNSEGLFSDTSATLRRVFEFIGVDPAARVKNLKPRNVGGGGGEDVGPEVRAYLDDYFRPHNQALYAFSSGAYGWDG